MTFRGDILDPGVRQLASFEDADGSVLGLHRRFAPLPSRLE